MIKLIALLVCSALAHEGHEDGPVGIAVGKYGGLIENIVAQSEKADFHDAKPLGKAELVRSGDGTTRVYIYDVKMKKVDLSLLAPKGFAIVTGAKGAPIRFALERAKKNYIGKMPKVTAPFELEVFLKNGDTEIFTEFENLD